MKQKYAFLSEEGDRWFERNAAQLDNAIVSDKVTDAIRSLGIKPKRVLEIGCANGWRLDYMRQQFGCEVMGVEPSMKAATEAAKLRVPVLQGTASCPPLMGPFDTVIYGFSLYLTDPEDWFTIVAEGDKLLADGGHLVIHDFAPSEPHAKRYIHRDGILAYHINFARLWLSHPHYASSHFEIFGDQAIWVLQKSMKTIPVLP